MRRRKFRRCLAVSTVIGNMLMILITLSLAAILVAWAGSTYGAFSGGSSLFFLQRGQALQERLVVEEVFFVKASNYMRVFVRNVGVEQLNIVAIYINGTSFQPASAWNGQTPGSGQTQVVSPCTVTQVGSNHVVSENVGAVCEFQLGIPNGSLDTLCGSAPWCSGDIINIVVATSRGNQATYTARAP